MSVPTTVAHTDAIASLRVALTGQVITPDDPTFDRARTVASGSTAAPP